jgi:uncharacterized protein with von Willebrand factor type A (vWA) domain
MDNEQNMMVPTVKTDRSIRKRALEEIFTQLNKGTFGNHKTTFSGKGQERQPESRLWKHGDDPSQIDSSATMMNMLKHSSIEQFNLREDDLQVYNTDHYTSASTVLLIDLSHSMILYGEDRITPAKKVAMALAELIRTKYPKDSLDVVVFGNDAWEVKVKDLPYLQVGPYHTNTVAGLELAMDLLRRRRNPNRQIFMITDGKPTCIIENGTYYQNSWGQDPKILNKTLNLANQCRKLKIPITTFMIAQDPYLKKFVEEFTEANNGKAFYAGLQGLGKFIFTDYERNKRKRY